MERPFTILNQYNNNQASIHTCLITSAIIKILDSCQLPFRTIKLFYDNESIEATDSFLMTHPHPNNYPQIIVRIDSDQPINYAVDNEDIWHSDYEAALPMMYEIYSKPFVKEPLVFDSVFHILIVRRPAATMLQQLFQYQRTTFAAHFHQHHSILIVFDECGNSERAAQRILLYLWQRFRYSRVAVMQATCWTNGPQQLLNIFTYHPYLRSYRRHTWQRLNDGTLHSWPSSATFAAIFVDRTNNLYGAQIRTEIQIEFIDSFNMTTERLAAIGEFRVSGINVYFLATLADRLNATLKCMVAFWYLMPDYNFTHFGRQLEKVFYHPVEVNEWVYEKEPKIEIEKITTLASFR